MTELLWPDVAIDGEPLAWGRCDAVRWLDLTPYLTRTSRRTT